MSFNSSKTVRKTLLSFGVDPQSEKKLEKLIRDLGRLDKEIKESGSSFRQAIDQMKKGDVSSQMNNTVSKSRKMLTDAQQSSRALLDQIVQELPKSLTRRQKADIAKAFGGVMEDITGRIKDTTKVVAKKTAMSLRDYYEKEFALNPQVRRRGTLNPNKVGTLSKSDLLSYQASEKVRLTGARNALKDAYANGTPAQLRTAQNAVARLEQSVGSTTSRLKELEVAAKDAAAAEKKRVREAEREAKARAKEAAKPSPEQQRVNRAVERIRQNDTNRRIDNGASQFKNQATLLRNYAVLGGGIGAGVTSTAFIIDLDRQFKQLQSIVNLTNQEMEELSTNLIDISEKTKFTATEVTDAAIVLGQAGLGKDDIQNALEGVTLFATAVGSDLKSAVDLATSTLGVFNKDSSQMVDIVDKMTTAVNSSKLNLDKLALGLQYSGNLAAQSNITFEETVSALGAMANSGIRAGSTLGTGLRQIIIALQKPSEGFKDKIHDLDLSMGDLDISTHGLIKVLRTLAQAGFTVRDAMETMQVRAASAYGAFANNIDVADDLNKKMQIGGSAARANATQMESLSNQMARLGSIAKSIVYESMEPLLGTITALTEKTADFLSVLRGVSGLLSTIAVPAGILVAALGARSVLKLGGSLLGGVGTLASGGGVGAALGTAARGIPFRGALGMLGLSNPWVLGATVLGTAATAGYNYFDGQRRSADRVDSTQAGVNESNSEIKKYDDLLKKVNGSISTLILKQNNLKDAALAEEIRKLNSEFKQQGLYIDSSVDSYDKLLTKMREFRNTADDAATFLREGSRENLRDNSDALLDSMFAGSFFDSDAETAARIGLLTGSRRRRPGRGGQSNMRQFTSINAGMLNSILANASPDFVSRLDANRAAIQNITPGSETALTEISSASAEAQGLARELVAILNSDPEKLAELFAQANINSPETQKDVKEFMANFAQQLFAQANTLLTVQGNEETYIARDSELVEKQRTLAKQFQVQFVEGMLDVAADINEEIRAVNVLNDDDATKDYLATYYKMREIVDERTTELFDIEAKALEELERQGIGAPGKDGLGERKQYLQRAGFYKNLGQAESGLRNSLRTSAEEAGPDAQLTFKSEIDKLTDELRIKQSALREATNAEDSQTLLSEANQLVRRLEEVRAKQDTFAGDLQGNSQPALDKREESKQAQIAAGIQNNEDLQLKTLNRVRLAQLLGERKDLGLKETKLNDDDLYKLLSEYITGEQTKVKNTFAAVQLQAQKLRNQADSEASNAERYETIAGDTSFSRDARESAVVEARKYRDRAQKLREDAIELEQNGVKASKDALAELAKYIREQIIENKDLSPGRAKTKAVKSEETLIAEQGKLTQSIEDLTQQNKQLEETGKNTNRGLDNLNKGIRANGFNSGPFAALKARLYGETNEDTDSGYFDSSNADGPRSLTGRLSEGAAYIGEELAASIDGYDGLTEMVMNATELAKGFGDQMAGTMADIILNVEDTDDAFKALFRNVAAQVTQMASQAAIRELLNLGVSAFSASAGTAYTGKHIIAGNYYTGGRYIGGGNPNRDSVYAKVSKGEFILRRRAVEALGLDTVKGLNAADPNIVKHNELNAAQGNGMMVSSKAVELNVWIVPKEEAANQQGEGDVIVKVADNITRNGVLKQLIKQVKVEA